MRITAVAPPAPPPVVEPPASEEVTEGELHQSFATVAESDRCIEPAGFSLLPEPMPISSRLETSHLLVYFFSNPTFLGELWPESGWNGLST